MWRDLGAYRLAERASLYVEIIFGIQRHSSLPSGDGYSFGIRRGQFLSRKSSSKTKKSRADSLLQYYEDLQGLKGVVVGHARPPEDTGNQPLKTALPCGQMDSNRHMTACIFDGEEISPNKYFRIYRFPEFWKYLIGFCWFQAKNFKCNMCFS